MTVAAESNPGTLTTTISRKWTLRMVIIGLVLFAFGLWGLYDAAVVYPARGARSAEWLEYQYLDQFATLRPPLDARASVADPKAELDRVERRLAETGQVDAADRALREWVRSLHLIGKREPATTTAIPRQDFRGVPVNDARERRSELAQRWTTGGTSSATPSPLSRWDIPVQWLITVLGMGIGLWMFVLLLRVRARRFTYEPATKRLTLPGGNSIVPEDIEDVDKRKWHKFFVAMKIKPSHPQLGGKTVEFDLLRFVPLEDWVLEMERAAFPDRAEAAAVEPSTPV